MRRAVICISELRRRADGDHRSKRKEGGIPVRIINGRQGEDLVMATKQDLAREEYTRGWRLPNAQWTGISAGCDGQMRCGGDVIEVGEVEVEFQKWVRNRKKNEKPPHSPPTPDQSRNTPTSTISMGRSPGNEGHSRETHAVIIERGMGFPIRRYNTEGL